MHKKEYNNYFVNHYGVKWNLKDIERGQKWFYAYWKLICLLIKIRKDARILEVGSGIGVFYSFLKEEELVKNYEGLELDSHACDFANKIFKTDRFKNQSLEKYFDKNNDKDFVFAFEVIEHLENPINSLNKIYKLLKKDSYFVGTSPYPYKKNILGDKTHQFVLHPENWKKLFLEAGFTKVDLHPMSFLPYIWKLNKKFNIRIPLYLNLPFSISTCLFICRK